MQNQKTLKKVLEELAKDKPDLSYMRGLLEGLVDGEVIHTVPYIPPSTDPIIWTKTTTSSAIPNAVDEAVIMEAKAKASLDTIKKLSEQSVEQN